MPKYRTPLHVAACIAAAAMVAATEGACAQTWRETQVANHFQIFVPPNNDVGNRFSAIVVTAMAGTATTPCVVDLTDVDDDGDSDDTVLGTTLVAGQSVVRYIRDGAVNDDMTGIRDGDYFRVDSTLPVAVLQATDSDWQHDWAPSVDGSMRGTRFVLYANGYSVSQRDLDVFAYEDGTRVELYDITQTALVSASNTGISGVTTLRARPSLPLLAADLDEGDDLTHRNGLGRDMLAVGRTYELVASKPVTVLFGAIASLTDGTNQAIDGAGYVPGRNGVSADTDFYFQIPHNTNAPHQQELRIVAFGAASDVLLRVFNPLTQTYDPARSWDLAPMNHADYVGGTGKLYRVTATTPVAVFEAAWFETGSPGTSDDAAFVPAHFTGSSGSQEFMVYLGPPGRETSTTVAGVYAHAYLYSREAVSGVSVVDADTNGTLFSRTVDIPALGYADVRIDEATYARLNRTALSIRPYLRVVSPAPISVEMSNWNDNWMTYATATVVRNPGVTLSAPSALPVGSSVTTTGTVTNDGSTPLTDVVVRVALPTGVTFISGDLGGAPETSVTTTTSGTEVRFDQSAIAAGVALPLTITMQATTSAGSTGEVLALGVSASAADGVNALASASNATTQVTNPGVATLSEFVALSGDRTLTLRVTATGAPSSVELSRSSAASGPWTTLRTEAHMGGVAEFTLTDNGVANNTTYYYRARAVGLAGAESLAGPIVGQPVDRTAPPSPTASAVAEDARVNITFGGSTAPDLLGYRIERKASVGATWTTLNATAITGPTFVDAGLSNGTAYEYRVRAYDDDGNISGYSATVRATPALLSSRTTDRVVFFEDLIGPGVNDWDYNDFVVRIVAMETYASTGGVQRVIIDYEPLARGAGYVHRFYHHIPVTGAWTATIARALAAGVQVETQRGNGDVRIKVLNDTRDALPPLSGNYANTALAQPRFASGGSVRVTIELDAQQNPSLGNAPWDPYLLLPYIRGNNEVHLGGWGGVTETADRSDLAGWPLDFAFAASPIRAYWPPEGQPVWRAFGSFSSWIRQGSHPSWHDEPSTPNTIWSRER